MNCDCIHVISNLAYRDISAMKTPSMLCWPRKSARHIVSMFIGNTKRSFSHAYLNHNFLLTTKVEAAMQQISFEFTINIHKKWTVKFSSFFLLWYEGRGEGLQELRILFLHICECVNWLPYNLALPRNGVYFPLVYMASLDGKWIKHNLTFKQRVKYPTETNEVTSV